MLSCLPHVDRIYRTTTLFQPADYSIISVQIMLKLPETDTNRISSLWWYEILQQSCSIIILRLCNCSGQRNTQYVPLKGQESGLKVSCFIMGLACLLAEWQWLGLTHDTPHCGILAHLDLQSVQHSFARSAELCCKAIDNLLWKAWDD